MILNIHRFLPWRHGNTKPVLLGAPAAATVIALGDFMLRDTTVAALPYNAAQHANFVGVASQSSRDGDTYRIRTATQGSFEHPCTPDTFEIGDLVMPAGPGTLVKTADPALAIGVVEENYPTATSTVRWKLRSVIFAGI